MIEPEYDYECIPFDCPEMPLSLEEFKYSLGELKSHLDEIFEYLDKDDFNCTDGELSEYLVEVTTPMLSRKAAELLANCSMFYCSIDMHDLEHRSEHLKPIYRSFNISRYSIFDERWMDILTKDIPDIFLSMGPSSSWQSEMECCANYSVYPEYIGACITKYGFEKTKKMFVTCWKAKFRAQAFSKVIKIYEAVVLRSNALSEDDWSFDEHVITLDFGSNYKYRTFGDICFPAQKINFQSNYGVSPGESIFPSDKHQKVERELFVHLLTMLDPNNTPKRRLARALSKLVLEVCDARFEMFGITIESSRLEIHFNH